MNKWKIRSIILAAVSVLASENATALEKYLCVGEKSTGFKWNGTSWDYAKFTVDKDKFLVEEIKERQGFTKTVNFVVKRFGEDKELYECNRITYEGVKFDRIWCGGQGDGMLMNTKELRFQTYDNLGYVDGKDGGSGTPSITIGTCTSLN